jgi:hypothetical protein
MVRQLPVPGPSVWCQPDVKRPVVVFCHGLFLANWVAVAVLVVVL